MTLTRISAVTAALVAILNVAVLFGLPVDDQQLAAINAAIVAVGSAVHVWFNPSLPLGPKSP